MLLCDVTVSQANTCSNLQAIDQQVDQIASAAGKALGSLWTGIGGAITSTAQAASSVAGQLEQAALQATSTNGRRPASWYATFLMVCYNRYIEREQAGIVLVVLEARH